MSEKEALRFCPQCGLARVARFCAGCGFDFGEEQSEQLPEQDSSEEPQEETADNSEATQDSPVLALEDESEAVGEASQEAELQVEPEVVAQQEAAEHVEVLLALDEVIIEPPPEPVVEEVAAIEPEPVGEGWYPDPTRKAEARFWDGYIWTDRVGVIDRSGAGGKGASKGRAKSDQELLVLKQKRDSIVYEGLARSSGYVAKSSCYNCGFQVGKAEDICGLCGAKPLD
jgi:hypothetical protein